MTAFEIEVIVRAVQVRRHHGYIVRAILQIETLAHLQTGYFGYRIRFVRVFERGGQKRLLFHGLRYVTRIDTCTSEKQQFLHAVPVTLTDDMLLNAQITVNKVGTVPVICHNPADISGCEKNIFGTFVVEKTTHGGAIKQIEFIVRTSYQVGIPLLLQVAPNGRPHQSTMPCHVYFG